MDGSMENRSRRLSDIPRGGGKVLVLWDEISISHLTMIEVQSEKMQV